MNDKPIYFISDLHLVETRPETTQLFLNFISYQATRAQALYILGDFFEAWIGDDNDSSLIQEIKAALKQLSSDGVKIYFMHGNRDFLIGSRFADECGLTLIPDPYVIDLFDTPTLLMHGDSLCVHDISHQRFRKYAYNPNINRFFTMLPLSIRKRLAYYARSKSKKSISQKDRQIMDVCPDEVKRVLKLHNAELLIHGHTHRPGMHDIDIDGKRKQRIVMSDWHETASIIRCDPQTSPQLIDLKALLT